METTIEFAPAIPFPRSFDVQQRIQELRGYLDPSNPDHQPEQQHTNIKAAIKLYEDGKIDGVEQVFIMDGKVVPEKEIFRGRSWSWSEGRCHQLAQKHAYGLGPFGVSFHGVSVSLLNSRYLYFLLQICMLLRLIPERGGNGTVYGIIIINNTGSDILMLFTTDLP